MLAQLQTEGFPVQSWQPGGVELTRTQAWATVLAAISTNYIPDIAGGGFIDFAQGDWLTLLAAERFNLTRNPATNTVGTVVLTAVSGAGPYTVTAGQVKIAFPSGLTYLNTTGGTIAFGSPLTATFSSEFVNDSGAGQNYVDASNSQISLVTSFPGVTATNPASTFSSVSLEGTSSGTIAPSGSPASSHQVQVRIDVSGQSGAASWSYSVDGLAFTSAGAVASASIGTTGITVTLSNGAGTPSFIAGDIFLFANPGTWITSQGTDEETDASLQTRCKARFPDLSVVPALSVFELWARTASSQVTQVKVQLDPNVNNKVNIVIAGAAGILPVGTVSTVQAYVNTRSSLTDYVLVSSPGSVAVTLTATITVASTKAAAIQAAVQNAVQSYMNTAGINGTIELAAIISAVMVSGAKNISGLLINGSAADLVLGSSTTFQIASFSQNLISSGSITWVLV